MNSTFDIRRPTTVVRHSTTDSRMSNVGRRPAVGCRMSNVVLWKDPATTQENTVKDAVTTEEVAPKTIDVAPKPDEVAPNVAPKTNNVAPKGKEPQESAVKSAVKNVVADEGVVDKCVALWSFLKEDPQRTITNAVERLSCSRRSIVSYIGILKQAKVLEHIGPYRGGAWKFLI